MSTRKTVLTVMVTGVGILLLALGIYLALLLPPELQPSSEPGNATSTNATAQGAAGPQGSPKQGMSIAPTPPASEVPPLPHASHDPRLGIFQGEDFRKTDIAQRWAKQGVDDADLAAALQMLRDRGFQEQQLRDPGLVGQFLPARNIEPVFIEGVTLPATTAAGQPIPFSLKSSFPSPAYTFERWEITPGPDRVVVRPVGSRKAEPVASVVVPVDLRGEIPALSAGDYLIRFEAIGEPIEKELAVR